MTYWLQTKAPAGNWVDNLGSENKDACITHGRYLREKNSETVRVIKRTDHQVWNGYENN
jgi:hypothetical protein